VTGCEFPRIQLRGSAGFSPASLLTFVDEDARTKEVEKEQKPLPGFRSRIREVALYLSRCDFLYCTVTCTGTEGMPLATTTRLLAPVSMPDGTSKFVDTILLPVATPMVL
jgi:hypothetical protein